MHGVVRECEEGGGGVCMVIRGSMKGRRGGCVHGDKREYEGEEGRVCAW